MAYGAPDPITDEGVELSEYALRDAEGNAFDIVRECDRGLACFANDCTVWMDSDGGMVAVAGARANAELMRVSINEFKWVARLTRPLAKGDWVSIRYGDRYWAGMNVAER